MPSWMNGADRRRYETGRREDHRAQAQADADVLERDAHRSPADPYGFGHPRQLIDEDDGVGRLGEDAAAEGEFHESLNLAALWDLPVLFCCENNLYAMGTALARSESGTDLVLKAASYRMSAWPVDRMDLVAVEETAREDAEAVRALVEAGARPDMIVAATHGLFVGGARDRLDAAGVRAVWATDSIAPLLADAVRRLFGVEREV